MTENVAFDALNDTLMKECLAVAEFFYDIYTELPENEKWTTAVKIHSAASDLVYYTAQAIGNAAPTSREYDWAHVRKHTYSLKTLYRFAHKQQFVKADPEMMLRLDKILEISDEKLRITYEQTKRDAEKEKSLLRERYQSWWRPSEGTPS